MRTGDVLRDRYELRERIALGGMGEVWRAFDRRLTREVAIKVGSAEPGAPTLLEEGRAAAQLDHPNIVAVHDADTHEGEPFIVMEYIAGPSLRQRLQDEGALGEAEATRIGVDILNALVYAHGRGVWHNDVKPENILIGPDGEARLSDFGIASVNATTLELGAQGPRFATPAYAAPEVLAGSPPGPSSDLYAAAMTIYECVSGRVPEREAANAGAVASIVQPPWEAAPGISDRLAEVLAHALEPTPSDRYGTAVAFRNALERSRTGGHPTVPLGMAAGTRPAAPASASSGRTIVLGSIIAGLLGVGIIGIVLALSSGGDDGMPGLAPDNGGADDSSLATNPDTPTGTATSTPTPTSTPTATPTPEPVWPMILYLHNTDGDAGDSPTLVDMPMTAQAGPQGILPNYSTDNDDRPGRAIDEDDEGAGQSDPSKFANWTSAPGHDLDFGDGYDVTVTFWYAETDWDGGEEGRFEVWLGKRSGNSVELICAGAQDVVSAGGTDSWEQVSIAFSCMNSGVRVGTSDMLDLKVTLNEHSETGDGEDMMIAYGTAAYNANLRIDPAGSGPAVAQPTPAPGGGRGGLWERAWDGLGQWAGSFWDSLRP